MPIVLYLSVMLWVMKDFTRVLILLMLVFAAMAGVVYLNYSLNQTTLAVCSGCDCGGYHRAGVPEFPALVRAQITR